MASPVFTVFVCNFTVQKLIFRCCLSFITSGNVNKKYTIQLLCHSLECEGLCWYKNISGYIYIYMYVSRGVINALGAMADALRPFKKRIYERTGE